MRMSLCAAVVAVVCSAVAAGADGASKPERIFRPPRHVRGNTGVMQVQPIDRAAWIAPSNGTWDGTSPRVVRFRNAFRSDGTPFEIDVTADERFVLALDGEPVARGPHRGSVANWTYQSYRLTPAAGPHVLEATVFKLGEAAPIAQLSHRLGFCLKASDPLDAQLTTGKGDWQAGEVAGIRSIGKSGGPFGTGDGFEIVGAGMHRKEAGAWTTPVVVKKPLNPWVGGAVREAGWLLYPSQLPDQLSARVRPGRFVSGGERSFPLTVGPGERRTFLWDLGRYICAYPVATVDGGRGGSLSWKWAEALKGAQGKGNRSDWQGKAFDGFGDRFVFDGRTNAVFSTPWFRCGRWCELTVEAGDEPVVIRDLALDETRYPLACETAFEAPDLAGLADIQRICTRSMQMCCHEMLFDCPYYEQQMYPGDTRVQLNVLSSMTADDAIIRRAIEIFDLNRRDDGFVPFNFPTRSEQDGASYTLCYLGMLPDYLRNHANRAWLKARLPGLRAALAAFEPYEREDGLLANLPGWNFLDWVPRKGWEGGCAPGTRKGEAGCELNAFYVLALRGAAEVESAFGNGLLSRHCREKADRVAAAIARRYHDAERGLFASDESHQVFSEHAQCLALLAEVVTGDAAGAVFRKLVEDRTLCPVSVYFSYYLFETYFKFGRGDLFLKRLDLWRGYVARGATTCLEEPEYPGHDARSDCHAWGAHPLWFLRTGLAGIRSDAPFFERVRIAPQPGGLRSLKAEYPHPSGAFVRVELDFDGGIARGHVRTPVAGTFAYGSQTVALKPGDNAIGSDH